MESVKLNTNVMETPKEVRDDSMKPLKKECIPSRYVLCFVAHVGTLIAYMVRFNLSVALVAMVNTSEASDVNTTSDDCPDLSYNNNSQSNQTAGEFNWDPEMQGTVLASFYYGYVVTQIPGGWLAAKIGGKWLVGSSVLGMSVLTLVTPLAARLGIGFLLAVRATMGIFGGVFYPGMHCMLGKWSPVWERTRMSAITYSGANVGIVLAFPITGVLCQYGFAGGWPSVFYLMGSAGCIWFVVWCFVAYNTPESHPRISQSELAYIQESIGMLPETKVTPWRFIITSSPVWAILFAGTCSTWGYYTLLTSLPTYMKQILKLDIAQNGFLSAIPYVACSISYTVTGFVADALRVRGILNTTRTRKLMVIIGAIGPAAGFVAISFVGCDRTSVIALIVFAVAVAAVFGSTTDVNTIDLAPNFAGPLMGVSNMVQNLAGIAAPFIVGIIINKEQNRVTWGRVFYITAGIYIAGMLYYCVFGSGSLQKWAAPPGLQQTVEVHQGEKTPLLNDKQISVQHNTVKR